MATGLGGLPTHTHRPHWALTTEAGRVSLGSLLMDEETEAQRCYVTFPRPHSHGQPSKDLIPRCLAHQLSPFSPELARVDPPADPNMLRAFGR